jgi:hypothetical protein
MVRRQRPHDSKLDARYSLINRNLQGDDGVCMTPTVTKAISGLEKRKGSTVSKWVIILSALCQCMVAFALPLHPQVTSK